MDIKKQLLKLKLGDKEVNLYEIILKNAPISITELAKLSGIKRTSIYFLLERLEQRGLVEKTIRGKRKFIIPANPERLRNMEVAKKEELEAVKELIDKTIPDLIHYYSSRIMNKPRLRFFEGSENVKAIMDEILNCRNKEYWYLGSMKLLEDLYLPAYWQSFVKRRVAKGIKSYSIINPGDAPEYKYSDPLREVRYAPEPNEFPAVIVIFDNKFGVISSKRENYGFLIESQDLVNIIQVFIKILWGISRPLNARGDS